jgi:CBS domain containing-hemolysin-like protein
LFSARHEVEYLNEEYSLGIPESDEYDTLAGYIIAEHGGIPSEGEMLHNELFSIKIISRKQSRLDVVSVRLNK